MIFALDTDPPLRLSEKRPFDDTHGVQRPAEWLDSATAAERQAAGVVVVVEGPPPPSGARIASESLVRVGSLVRLAITFEPAPPTP